MMSRKAEHVPVHVTRSDNSALDTDAVDDHRHIRDGEVFLGHSNREDGASGCHDGQNK